MIKTVAVIGAGAVGSFFLKGLTENPEQTCCFAVAQGERAERLKEHGLRIDGETLRFPVRTPLEAAGADLVIVCVKYGALPETLNLLDIIVDNHTVILSPINGIDSEEIIAGRLGREHILHSMMIIAAERQGNEIRYNKGVIPTIHLGCAQGYGSEGDLQEVTEFFAREGLSFRVKEDILETIWNKFALNISTNIAQAIVGCGYGAYKTSPYMNTLGQTLCDELLQVARAKQIPCTFDYQRALRTMKTDDRARFSTLQDLTAGRHTEVDMFCGVVVRMGKECSVPTPFHEFAWLTIKAMEEKNDGLI